MQVPKGRDQVSGGVSVPCQHVWNAKLTYIQIFIPIFKYLDLGTNHLYLSSNHLYLASNHLYLGTNDLKIGINDLYLGLNDLYLSSNATICMLIWRSISMPHPSLMFNGNFSKYCKRSSSVKSFISRGSHCIWSGHRMSLNIRERGISYCLIRSLYRP